MIAERSAYQEQHREVGWPIMAALTAPLFLGCFSIYLYRFSGEGVAIAAGIILLAGGLLACTALILFAGEPAVSGLASSVALVHSIALFVILLPGSGLVFVDATITFAVVVAAVLLFERHVELPKLGRSRLRESSVLMVLALPAVLAIGETLFLGLRFWENYQIGRPSILFVPLIALWGFLEEALFRGIVQRSAVPLLGGKGSIVLGAFLNAALMFFWGSLPYAFFSFLVGLLMGYLYLRTRSLMYVGTIHALQDTWMIIAYVALGIVMH